MNRFSKLTDLVSSHKATVGIIGLGYVGLPVALAIGEIGFNVLGMDLDEKRIDEVRAGRSYLEEIPSGRISTLVNQGRLNASNSYQSLQSADIILICVPTPISDGTPDLSRVLAAGAGVAPFLKAGSLVVLESTTYPGTTEDLLRPVLEESGLTAGIDFALAFSPERIDPGNPVYQFQDIPKVVGGLNPDSTRVAALFYEQVCPSVHLVRGPREAELSKLIENTFRHVNIALINELAVYAREMGIDIWESIEAAATKPFGFMPFWPSPGWGGHCIPLDPAYLSWQVRRHRSHEVRFVELAQSVNSEMPRYVAERITLELNEQKKPLNGSQVCGIGVAYKAGIKDTRESPALKVLSILASRGANASFHDPLVDSAQIDGREIHSANLSRDFLRSQDITIVFIPQAQIDWALVAKEAPLLFDCCNILDREDPRVIRL
jgi:UDP-N-acetyl-D-glucosamine dehydrogenase